MESSMFSPEFWSVLIWMGVFGIGGGMIVRSFPSINQLSLRRIFVVSAFVTALYNFTAVGLGGLVETVMQFAVGIYFFTIVAEQRLVELPEIWTGKKPDRKK